MVQDIKKCYKEIEMTNAELILEAKKARERAYVPYSHHSVGAALVTKSVREDCCRRRNGGNGRKYFVRSMRGLPAGDDGVL